MRDVPEAMMKARDTPQKLHTTLKVKATGKTAVSIRASTCGITCGEACVVS